MTACPDRRFEYTLAPMEEDLKLVSHLDGVALTLWVRPGAKRDEIVGIREGMLEVRISAPPRRGAANEAVKRFLARRLGVPRTNVEIVAGHHNRRKHVRVANLSPGTARRVLLAGATANGRAAG